MITTTIVTTVVNKGTARDQLVSYGANIEMKEVYQLSGIMTDRTGIKINRIHHLHN